MTGRQEVGGDHPEARSASDATGVRAHRRFRDELEQRSIYFSESGSAFRGRRMILRDPDLRAGGVLDRLGVSVAGAGERIDRAAAWAARSPGRGGAPHRGAGERVTHLGRLVVERDDYAVVDITGANAPARVTRQAVRELRTGDVDARFTTVYFGQALPGTLSWGSYPTLAGDPNVSSAAPTKPPARWDDRPHRAGAPAVAVLDTGLSTLAGEDGRVAAHPWLRRAVTLHQETWDLEDVILDTEAGTVVLKCSDEDRWDENGDDRLDRQAGHGTFIAGIVRRLAPASAIHVEGCLTSFGDGDDESVTRSLRQLVDRLAGEVALDHLIVNLSFGGYTDSGRPPPLLSGTIADLVSQGVVFVAAAGNDNTPRRMWPAALPGVIAVGGLDGRRKAWFSNYGDWVDACAPAVDAVSTFFGSPGDAAAGFHGFARWSGTSFAAPRVAAAIANAMGRTGAPAAEAAATLIGDPSLHRVRDLGVVVT